MRAVSLHDDVVVVTSALLSLNCAVVRSPAGAGREECFVIDSPLLPEELELLPSLVAQAGFPAPSGLLATHADWDHLLGRLAFPELELGCSQSSAERIAAAPGEAQRGLRDFDESLYVARARPLSLGRLQALPVPGRLELGEQELELHAAEGHTGDGMALWLGWAGVLVAGDYLSAIEIPSLGPGGSVEAYLATLARLRPLAAAAQHVLPGHGPVVSGGRAVELLAEDQAYLNELAERGASAALPAGRRSREQRRVHERNAAAL